MGAPVCDELAAGSSAVLVALKRHAGELDQFGQVRLDQPDALLNHRAHFERIRRDFFFIDQFPENEQRFDVKFEDCQSSPGGPIQA